MPKPKITPFLWFDTQAEEAANLYVSIFKDAVWRHEIWRRRALTEGDGDDRTQPVRDGVRRLNAGRLQVNEAIWSGSTATPGGRSDR
jgi:hypothetical protein